MNPTMRLFTLLLLGLATVLPACSILGGDDAPADGRVRVTAEGSTGTIRNGTGETVYYAAFAHGVVPFIQWVQHVDGEPDLAPGQHADLTAGDVWRFAEAEPEVVVFWWRVEVREGERVPAEPNSVVVEL